MHAALYLEFRIKSFMHIGLGARLICDNYPVYCNMCLCKLLYHFKKRKKWFRLYALILPGMELTRSSLCLAFDEHFVAVDSSLFVSRT